MENFLLRFFAAGVSSMIAYHFAFWKWWQFSAPHHHEPGLGAAGALLFESYLAGFLAAIVCFALVFILMGRRFPIRAKKVS